MIKLIYGVLLAFFGAVLVHIAVVFLVPRLTEPHLMKRLAALPLTNEQLIFSGSSPEQKIAGLDPFFRYRVCFFDLEDGPFRLTSSGDVPYFSAALVSEKGEVIFSITDRQTINRTLNVEVRSVAERQSISSVQVDESSPDSAVPVFVNSPVGYAIIRAFVPDESWSGISEKFLDDIECLSGESAS